VRGHLLTARGMRAWSHDLLERGNADSGFLLRNCKIMTIILTLIAFNNNNNDFPLIIKHDTNAE